MTIQTHTVDTEHANDRDELKEVKVQIRISQHIKLHTIRLLREQTLSETVRDALDRYFSDLADQQGRTSNGRG